MQSADVSSDIDRYLDSSPENWSHSMIADGDPDWILKWWKAIAIAIPSNLDVLTAADDAEA